MYLKKKSGSEPKTFFFLCTAQFAALRINIATCGCRKFQLDPLGDHLNTCTAHPGAKKAHDWMVDQVAYLFRTTHKIKTQQVVKNRGQDCGDIQLEGYVANEAGPVPLVLDLRI